MAIDSKHPMYTVFKPLQDKCVDVYEGEDIIKAKGKTYTPKLSGQTESQYDNYRNRGMLNPAMQKTIEVLTGMMLHKKPTIKVPAQMEYILEDATGTGLSIYQFIKMMTEQIFLTGRYGVLQDRDTTGSERVFLIGNKAQDIHNWLEVDNELDALVLEDSGYIQGEDRYDSVLQERLKEIIFIEHDGGLTPAVIIHTKDKKGYQPGAAIPLTVKGASLEEIPFTFVNTLGASSDLQKPPFLDLVNVILSHWKNSVDLEHGRHWCALPTPWISGMQQINTVVKPDGTTPAAPTFSIGSENAWLLGKESKVGMLEFTGAGLASLVEAINNKEKLIATIGASWLAGQKKGVETAEAARINKAGDSATLTTVATAIESALIDILNKVAMWEGIDNPEIEVQLNKDFIDSSLDAATIKVLLESYMSDALSLESFLYNLQNGEHLPENVTIEDEVDKIEIDKSKKGSVFTEGANTDTE